MTRINGFGLTCVLTHFAKRLWGGGLVVLGVAHFGYLLVNDLILSCICFFLEKVFQFFYFFSKNAFTKNKIDIFLYGAFFSVHDNIILYLKHLTRYTISNKNRKIENSKIENRKIENRKN
jgi:hypothetical protein